MRRQTIGNALALAATLEGQHQAGQLGRAAAERRPEAERATPALDFAGQGVGKFECRIPHQRAVGEDPSLLAGLVTLQGRGEAGRALLGRQEEIVACLVCIGDDLIDTL